MTDEQITIEVAKLDGLHEFVKSKTKFTALMEACCEVCGKSPTFYPHTFPPYLTSRDAIIPVIEKHWKEVNSEGWAQWQMRFYDGIIGCNKNSILFATPRQLCIALLKATGHYP